MMGGESGQRRARIILVGVLLLVGLLSFLYISRFLEIRHLRAQIADIARQEQAALAMQNRLRDRLAHADDAQTIEYLARKELGLVKPGEEKVIFIRGN